jgi:hypothetical protein
MSRTDPWAKGGTHLKAVTRIMARLPLVDDKVDINI